MANLKFNNSVFKSSNKSTFCKCFFKLFLHKFFLIYQNVYQLNIIKKIKKDYKKKLVKDIEIFLKKKKTRQYGCEPCKNLLEDEKK